MSTDQIGAHGDGLTYASPEGKLGLSQESIDHIVDTFARLWSETLVWGAKHPILFIFFLLFALVAYAIRRQSKVDIASMKLEYKNARSKANGQLPLPLEDGGHHRR